jgi:hypothetical protein
VPTGPVQRCKGKNIEPKSALLRRIKSVGRSFCAAAAASALQMLSIDTGCDGVWLLPSAAPIPSGSVALACSVKPTALKSETNRTSADPAMLRMFLPVGVPFP